jgi:NhaP-type Na+/H+ or K+/H+ antiporter
MSGVLLTSIVLFIGISLLLSIFCYELKRHLKIPVSTSLIILGIIFREVGPYIGQLKYVVEEVIHIDPHVISFAFFPVLIFEASFGIDWYTIKKEFWQIIPLATTVVVSCSALTALSLRYIFSYDYPFNDLFLIGVILSATDHIAVEALLKEIFASDTFETLIGGETMFNDATVLVLFEVLIKKNTGISGFEDSVVLFFRLVFGGLAMGLAFSIVMSFVLKRTLNDFFIEFNITIIAAYLLFWICEYGKVHFSGALALVSYGLFMSAYGKTLISPSVEERLKELLELLSRNVESLVFIIAGILFANISINESSELDTKDYYVLFILFPLTYLIRFVVLLVHFPVLRYFGYGLSWKELIVLCFAGMKGVISVGLALIASHDDHFEGHTKALINYFGIGIAGLSIILGGPATRFFVKVLGLEEMTPVQENMLIGVTSALAENIENQIEELRKHKESNLVNWDKVNSSIGTRYLIESIIKKTQNGKNYLKVHSLNDSKELLHGFMRKTTVRQEDLKIEMRKRYLATLKGLYWEKFEEGLCHGETALVLMDSAMISIDKENEEMNDWQYAHQLIYNEFLVKMFKRLSKSPVMGKIFRKMLYKKIILAYDAANNFIKCHEETEELIDKMEIDTDKNVFKAVIKEAHRQVRECEKFMKIYIIDCYPEVLAEVQTKRSCKILLYTQRELISEIYEDGLIKELEYESLISAIDSSIKAVTFQGIPSLPILKDILTYRFTTASSEEILTLISKSHEFEFASGHVFFSEGQEANGAYLIIRGRVNEFSTWIDQELIIGNIVGVQHLLEEFSMKYASTAKAITHGVAAHIPKEIVGLSGFVEDMYSEAAEEMILLNKKRYGLEGINSNVILQVMEQSKVECFSEGKSHVFTDGALIMKGMVELKDKSVWIIKPKNKKRKVLQHLIVLLLPKNFYLCYDENEGMGKAFEKFCGKNSEEDAIEDLESKIDDSSFILSGSEMMRYKA